MQDEMISLIVNADFEVQVIDFSEVAFVGNFGFLAPMRLRRLRSSR